MIAESRPGTPDMTKQITEALPTPEYQKIKDSFLAELTNAAQGNPSSVSFIRHHFPRNPIVEEGNVMGLVIGGTNFIAENAYIRPDGTINAEPETRLEEEVPTFTDADTLFNLIGQHIAPETEAVGINFAFPLKPVIGLSHHELDGVLVDFSKEHTFSGLINGIAIGEGVKKHIGRHDLAVSVANDTICLGENGLIVGTGFNISFETIENDARIPVNIEAGNFDKFQSTPELDEIDRVAENPGGYRYEKMLSGKYLPLHYNLIAKKLGITPNSITNTRDLSELAIHDSASGLLAKRLLSRSAGLVATALAAIYEYTRGKPLTFTTDGSVFWKGYHYKESVEKYLKELDVPEDAITFEKRPDVALHGAFALLTRTQ